jgi:hypothetical protein
MQFSIQKPMLECHKQAKKYLMENLKYIIPEIDQHSDLNQRDADQKLKELNSVYTKQDSRWGRSSSLVRTLALRAKGRRFKSGSAHHPPFLLDESTLFTELHVENCVINCFKWFSKVLLRLKPRDLDFSTKSLSRYNTTLPLVPIAFASEGMLGKDLCFKSGLLAAH